MSTEVGRIHYTVTLETAQMVDGQRAVERSTQAAAGSLNEVARASRTHAEASGIAARAAREHSSATEAAAKASKTYEMSAKQLAAALRGVPAQFTDIATSIAAGQNPLTVFLQQGGQLKDIFGGIGPAARALGGYIVGLITPMTVAAAGAIALAAGFFKGRSESEEFKKALTLTGNQAGVTADHLTEMTQRMDGLAGVTRGRAADAVLQFVNAGIKGADAIEIMSTAAARLAAVGGPAVETTAKAFVELGKAPSQAALKLNESTGFLTKSLFEQIKALEEQGRHTEAAKVAQNAYAESLNGKADEIVKNLGSIERGWLAIKTATSEAVDGLASIGVADTARDEFNKLFAERQKLTEKLGKSRGFFDALGGGQVRDEERIAAINQRLRELQDAEMGAQKAAAARAADKTALDAENEWGKLKVRNMSEEKRLLKEIEEIKSAGQKAGKSQADIDALIAEARAKDGSKKSGQVFDEAGYIASLESAHASELQRVSVHEAELLRKNDELRQKKKISEEVYAQAVELIVAEAEQKRGEIMLKEQERIDAARLTAERKAQSELNAIKTGREFAKEQIAAPSKLDQIAVEEEQRIAKLEEYRLKDLENTQLYEDAKLGVQAWAAKERKAIDDKEAADKAQAQSQLLGGFSQMFGAMADIQKTAGKEQGSLYKTLFAASKGFAIAQSIIAIQTGAAQAYKLGWPAGIAAAASTLAQGASLISTIKGTSYGGGRQFGGPVSAGKMYRVNETGQPEMFTAANGSQYMLPTKNGNVTAANQVGGGVQWSIIVNNSAAGTQASASVDESRRTVTIAVNEVASQISSNTGTVWNAMRSSTNVRGRM